MDIKSDEHNLHDYEETKLIVREKIFTLHFDDPSSKTLAKQDSKHGPQVTEKNEKSQDEDIQNTSSEPLSTDFVMTEPLGIKVSQADDNGEYQAISHPLENEIQENSQQPDSIFHPLETENQENSQQPSSISHSLETEAQEYSQQPASISHPLETEIQMNNQQPSSISHPLETETQENNQQPSNISHPLETETQENSQQPSNSEMSIGSKLLFSVASLGAGGLLASTLLGSSDQANTDQDFVTMEPLGIEVSQADDNGDYQAISHPLETESQVNSQQPSSIFHPLETENQEYSQQPASISHPLETETQENNQHPSNISHPLETETQENNQQLSSSEVSIGRNLLLSVASLGGGGLLARTFFGTSEQAYIDRDLPKSESHFQLKIICLLWTVIATTNCLNCLIHCYGCSKPVTIVYTSFLWVLCYLILRQLD